uniref:Tudor domain-containing protein 7 n=1 Tax=Bursaphelenchus xylophilus TaxID=6326 RepID=A0A1I7RLB9_BURXY
MDSTEQIQNMLVSTVAANVDGIMLHKLESTFKSDWDQDLKDHFDKLGVSNITELVLSMKNRLQLLGNIIYQVNDGNIQDVVDLITESKTINIEEKNQKNAMKARQREREKGRSTYKNSTSVNVNQRAKSFFSSSNAIVKPIKSVGRINGNEVPLPPGKFFNSTYSPAPKSSNVSVLDLFTSGLKKSDAVTNITGPSIATPYFCSTGPSTSKTYNYGNPHIPFFTSLTPPNPSSVPRGFGVSNTVEDELDGAATLPEKPTFGNARYNSDMFFKPGHRNELEAKFGISSDQVSFAKTDPPKQQRVPEENPFGKYPVTPSDAEFGVPQSRKPVNGTGNFKFIPKKIAAGDSNRKKNVASVPDGYKKSIAGFIQSNGRNMRMPPVPRTVSRVARFAASMSATEPARKVLDPDWYNVMKCVNIIKERGKVKTKTLEKLVEQEFGCSLDKAFMKKVFGVEIPFLTKALLMMKDTVFRYNPLADCFELKCPYEEIVEKFEAMKKPQELEETSKGDEKEETTVSEALTNHDQEALPSSLEEVSVKDEPLISEEDLSTATEGEAASSIKEMPDAGEPSSTKVSEILNDGFDITERTNETIFSHSAFERYRNCNVEAAPNSMGSYRQKQVSESGSDHSQSALDIINQIVLPDEAKDFDSMTNTITEIDGTAFYVNKTIRTLLMVVMQFDENEKITIPKIAEALLYESRGQMELTVELMNEAFGLKVSTVEEAFKSLPQFFSYIDGEIALDSFLPYFLEEGYTLVFDKYNRIRDGDQMLRISPSCIQNAATVKE